MYNDLFSIGPFTVHGYGLMIAVGVLTAILVADKRAPKKGLDSNVIYSLALVCVISGFAGAKLLFLLLELKRFLADPWAMLTGSGFVVYGGIIAGVLAAVVYCRIKKLAFYRYFDLAAPSIVFAQGFGRLGCFLAGCCYGRETDSFLGIVFHNSDVAPNGIKLLPTQLISSAGDFLIGFILILYARKQRRGGKVAGLYCVLYSIGRFIIEFFRADYRGSIAFLSTSQFISIFTLLIGLFLMLNKRAPAGEPVKEAADTETPDGDIENGEPSEPVATSNGDAEAQGETADQSPDPLPSDGAENL